MKPFKLTPKQKTIVNRQYRERDRIVGHFSRSMQGVMEDAVDFILAYAKQYRDFRPPALTRMNEILERFYVEVINGAIRTSKKDEKELPKVKGLAKLPIGLPKKIVSAEKIFKDRKYFRSIMNRSRKLTESLRKQYLRKLKKQFEKVMPALLSGEIEVGDAKKVMLEVWEASKSRVETIFRTETTKYFAEVQVRFFSDDEEIIGFLFDSVRDTSRTEICKSRHGLIYRPNTELLKKNTPPCHYNCRSHLIALANTTENRKMLEERDRDPSRVKVVPLPRGWQ